MVIAKEAHNDRVVASAQDEIRRLAGNGNAYIRKRPLQLVRAFSIVGKIIGHGALPIFGRVEGEVRASIVVGAEGAEMVGLSPQRN